MSIRSYSSLALSTLFLAGCATNHFDRNEQFSNSGTLYTDSVNELLDKTKDRLIDVHSELLFISPRDTIEGRRAAIEEQNASLAQLLDKIDEFRGHNQILGRYFTELRIVSNADRNNDIGITLAEISQTIANLNQKAIDKDGFSIPRRMNDEEKSQISTIADHMVKTHLAKKIQRQLRHDSQIIETQFQLQGMQLDQLIDLMKDTLEEGNMLHLNTQVIEPYVKSELTPLNIPGWKSSRAEWFEMRRTEHVFEAVKEAQLAMLSAWRDIVRGKRDISSVNNSLKEVNDFVLNLNAFKTGTSLSTGYTTLQ